MAAASPPSLVALRTALLVCEVPDLQHAVADLLRQSGFDVLAAGTAAEADLLAASRCGDLDLVLLDASEPDESGLDLAVRLKRRHADLRVACLDGGGMGLLRGYLRENLVDAFLPGAFSAMAFGQMMEGLFHARAGRRRPG